MSPEETLTGKRLGENGGDGYLCCIFFLSFGGWWLEEPVFCIISFSIFWWLLFGLIYSVQCTPGRAHQAGGGPWSVVKLEKPVTCTFLIGTSS